MSVALKLDESERAYLFDLAKAASAPDTPRRPRKPPAQSVRPSIERLLDSMVTIPAFVRNGRLDILAINAMGRALYCQAYDRPGAEARNRPVNLARFVFLDPRAHLLHPNWSDSANTSVSILRTEAGRNPYDKGLTDLVGELSTRSEEFRSRWAAHNVRAAQVGDQTLPPSRRRRSPPSFDALELPGEPGLTLTAYAAEPGTTAADNLTLLASWAATNVAAEPVHTGTDEH